MKNSKGSRKLNFMRIRNNVFMHRQIERRNGRIFMRAKTRPLIILRSAGNG